MANEFSDKEEELIQFLKAEYLEKGEAPQHASAPGTFHRDVVSKLGLSIVQYRELVADLEVQGLVEPVSLDVAEVMRLGRECRESQRPAEDEDN